MSSFDQEFHRTLVQLLIECNERELAAVMVDGGVELMRDRDGNPFGITLDVPTHAYELVSGNPILKQSLVKTAKTVINGHLSDEFGNVLEEPSVKLRLKICVVEPD